MLELSDQTSRLRRAVLIGVLLTAPLAPLTACGDGYGDRGENGVENGENGEGGENGEDDGGGY